MRLPAELAQQSVLNLFSRHVSHMQHPALGVATLLAEIELAMAGGLALIELQPKFHQISDSIRTFHDNRANGRLVAKSGACLECVAYVQLERIFIARYARYSSLRPGCVCVGAFTFCNYRNGTMLCHLQRKTEASDAASDHNEIVFLHASRMLSIKRVLPKNTASASSEFELMTSIGCKLPASTRST